MDLKSKIRRIPEFKGVVFWDICKLLASKDSFKESIKVSSCQSQEGNSYEDYSNAIIGVKFVALGSKAFANIPQHHQSDNHYQRSIGKW